MAGEGDAGAIEHETHKEDYNDKYDSMEAGNAEHQNTDFSNAKARRSGGKVVLDLLKQVHRSLEENKKTSEAEKISSEADCNSALMENPDDGSLIKARNAIAGEITALGDERTNLST